MDRFVLPNTYSKTCSVLVFGAVLLSALYAIRKFRISQLLPPGPRGFPFLGCLFVLRTPDKRKLFAELRAQHGDVFSFNLGCRLVVVINGFETLRQAFVHQGGSFTDRPRVFTFTHLGQGRGLGSSSGDVWREHRNFTLNMLRNLAIGKTSFAQKIKEELMAFCNVLDKTEGADTDPNNALQTAIANITCSIIFGDRFDYRDPVFQQFLQMLDTSMHISDAMVLLNFFPFLLYMPGDFFEARKELKTVENVQSYLRKWLDKAQERYDPKHVNNFADAYFHETEEKKKNKSQTTFSYDQLLKLVEDLLIGNAETTATTLRWLTVFLARWPHLQQKMREEIESVYPFMATPSVQDRRFMPYVEAVILETERFADIAPFSVTHAACQDVEMKGLLIPKGSLVIPNIHSVHYDPALWGDPEVFRPERFLDSHGEVVKPEYLIPFFLGKRSCPGEALARMQLFQFIITILQRYDILPPKEGRLPSLADRRLSFTYSPCPYKVRFAKRDHTLDESTGKCDGSHS